MRLTLRTLLAWMDGVLPAEDQRQLGEKVEESLVARKLIERIGGCVGNPHLSAPRIEGKGLAVDPDSVAEYLDNTLAPDRLEAFETICLESDMHLAEVAACHAILAEVAKHPEVLPPLDARRRRRLLEAMQHRVAAHPEVLAGNRPDPRGAGLHRTEAPQPTSAPTPPRDRQPGPAAKAPIGTPDFRELLFPVFTLCGTRSTRDREGVRGFGPSFRLIGAVLFPSAAFRREFWN